ncbi:MAG: alpha-amylase [Faecalibacterium sp.]|nr:alpha-amylase [Faecalibacterium sp.]
MKHSLACRIGALMLALCVGLCGCGINSQAPVKTPATDAALQSLANLNEKLGGTPDDNYRTFYEIFVYSFCDSDGNGIGDLKGVETKLDYLAQLGITGIWLMPIMPSQSYHKYDVRDYYAIDEQYGTMADFDSLLAACHERGINVIIDLVLNHTGDDHEWFLTACEYLKTLPADATPDPAVCPYVDYYFFVPTGSKTGAYHQIEGSAWSYEGQFSPDMPDLNWECEAMRAELKEIMEYWLVEKDVDGFRLDAAKEFYSGNVDKNIEVLDWIQTTATAIRPDAYLVAEVWENFSNAKRYYESGITSIFDFPFGNATGAIVKTVNAAGKPDQVTKLAQNMEMADSGYRAANPDYIGAPFFSNHDIGRIGSFFSGDVNEIKLGSAISILMSGSCFIYYGEELGMPGSGNDPSKRAPMLWSSEQPTEDTTGLPPECVLPEAYPLGGLAEQVDDDWSVYNYYRQAIAIRNAIPVVARGAVTCEAELSKNSIAAVRKSWNGQECLLVYNINPEAAAVDLTAYEGWTLAAGLVVAEGDAVTLKDGSLQMPAYGAAVLLPAED